MKRLRLGILQVNHDKSEAVGDRFPDDAHRFRDLFDALEQRYSYRIYMTIGGEVPLDVDEQDAFLITGSPLSVLDDHPWLPDLYAFIRKCDAAKKPLLGACFGHQAIAMALGGKVERAQSGWNVGMEPTEFVSGNPLVEAKPLNFFVFHQDQVTALPPGTKRVGTSARCVNAAFAKDQHILTTQMHPEFTPAFMHGVVDDCEAMLGAQTYAAAKASLTGTNDGPEFAAWADRFFQQGMTAP